MLFLKIHWHCKLLYYFLNTSSPSSSSETFIPIFVSIGSVNPPQTTVVKIMTDRVVQVYKSRFSPGIFSDRAKAMAPLSPANHITTCILPEMALDRKLFASKAQGKVLKKRATKQQAMTKTLKPKFQPLKRPVKNPIPMYRKTKNSDKTASDLNILCAVTWEVGDKL